MSQPFMGLFVIVRDAEATIRKMLESVRGIFDEIVIIDTGSSDKTKQIVAEHFEVENPEWNGHRFDFGPYPDPGDPQYLTLASFEWVDDFSAARQFCYELGTSKWRFYLDSDDEVDELFRTHLRKHLENTDKNFPEVNAISMPYRYTTDGGMVQDKIFRGVRWDGGWEWNDPLHEHLDRKPGHGVRNISKYVDLVVKHQAPTEARLKVPDRNLRILKKWYSTATRPEKKALAAYYLAGYGNELNQHEEARLFFREAVDGLGRNNIACDALCKWSRMEARLGNTEKSISLAAEAISKAPELPDGLASLAVAHHLAGEKYRAAGLFDQLYQQPKPIMESTHDAIWLDGIVNVHAASTYYHCGRIADATKALERVPQDLKTHPEIQAAGVEVQSALMKTEGFRRLHQLWEYLIWDTEPLKAKQLLEQFAPAAISDSPQVQQLLRQTEAKMPQMKDWAAYQRTYAAIPDLPYHVPEHHREWTKQQGRARLVAQWAASLPKEGPPVEVLAIGIQDGIIEGQMLENCPRIILTACDVAPQASRGINKLIERFPGRVKTYQVKDDHFDWFGHDADTFDAVIFFEVIEHLPDLRIANYPGDRHALDLINLHLKPGGRLFLSTPIAASWVEPYLSDMKSDRPWWHVRAHNPTSLWNLLWECDFTGSLIGLGQENLFLASMTKNERLPHRSDCPFVAPPSSIHGGPCSCNPGPSISIYCYPLGKHGFDPFSIKQGHTGGSEEAVIHLSAALAKKGVRVTVFTDMPKRADTTFVHQGVQWRPLSEFDPAALTGTLLVWRAPPLAAQFKRANPKLRTLSWLHDTNYETSSEVYEQADGTIVLSKFHAEALKKYDGYTGKVLLASNGIVPEEFPEPDESKRNPHSAIYASAPNRGLEFLLETWPLIRKQVPDATLRVYYSWKYTEEQMMKRPEVAAVFGPLLTKLRRLLEELKDQGVTYLGGVDHKTLNEAYRTSGVWAYPVGASGFEEIHCISALRAQASGCWPVIIPLGALNETCPYGTRVDPNGLPADSEVLRENYARVVAIAMKVPIQPGVREGMRKWALEQSWDNAADTFIRHSKAKNERITIFAGAFGRRFSAAGSADGKPLGGSEEAVIALARGLVKAGKEVVVYAPLPEKGERLSRMVEAKRADTLDAELVDDGATWIDASKFHPAGPHGTLIAWRCPHLMSKLKGNGYPVILWLMDPNYSRGTGAAAYDYSEADDVVFLTEAHKDIIARNDGYVDGGSVVHVGLPELPDVNGTVRPRRDPNAVMWATSPDRGLLETLKDWPQVLDKHPEAKLHIFYGLEPLRLNGKMELADQIDDLIETTPRVEYHGGVSDSELIEWYQRCSLLVVPSVDFEETQSISTCKAMALGCWPVIALKGALPELLPDTSAEYPEPTGDVLNDLIDALGNPPTTEMRTKLSEYARKRFSTQSMVEKMLKVIEGVQ